MHNNHLGELSIKKISFPLILLHNSAVEYLDFNQTSRMLPMQRSMHHCLKPTIIKLCGCILKTTRTSILVFTEVLCPLWRWTATQVDDISPVLQEGTNPITGILLRLRLSCDLVIKNRWCPKWPWKRKRDVKSCSVNLLPNCNRHRECCWMGCYNWAQLFNQPIQ